MTQVTVRLYKQGDKVWRDFKAELLKRYENSAMLDISKAKHSQNREARVQQPDCCIKESDCRETCGSRC